MDKPLHLVLAHRWERKKVFHADVKLIGFSRKEKEQLEKYGAWMQALASGLLQPYTQEQQRFIDVTKEIEAPISAFEALWVKYVHSVKMHKQSETKKIMGVVNKGILSYEQLQAIVDNSSKFSFSDDEKKKIQDRMKDERELLNLDNTKERVLSIYRGNVE